MSDNKPKGAPCWADLLSSDTAAAEHFYSGLFGWAAEAGDEEKYGGYIMFRQDGAEVAGCMHNDGSQGSPDGWSVYLSTQDTEKTIATAAEHGATVYMPAMEVPDVGVMGMVADPGGSAVGIWQAKPFGGFEATGRPGTPAWFELYTRSYADAVPFYRDVFGWDTHVMSDTDEFRYTTLGQDRQAAAGIMDGSVLPADAPMRWAVYWQVEDVDASVALAESLGGSVVRAAEDTPFGRLAELADPTGATFKVMTPPAG
jgi:uncharacterized protein